MIPILYSGFPSFEVKDMVGKTFTKVERTYEGFANEGVVFVDGNNDEYIFHHIQDCCESVGIHEIVGDLGDLVGSPMLVAEVASNSVRRRYRKILCTVSSSTTAASRSTASIIVYPTSASAAANTLNIVGDDEYESQTWTFYKFSTINGSVTMSWQGTSNGYYSVSVDQTFVKGGRYEDAGRAT